MSFRSALLGVFLLVSAASAEAQQRDVQLFPDSDFYGFDLRTEMDMSLDACRMECLADPGCKAFTHNEKHQRCFLKHDFSTMQPFAGATAGRVIDHTSEADLGAPPRLDFLPQYVTDEAVQYRAEVLRQVNLDPATGFATLNDLAEEEASAGNPLGAMEQYRSALAILPDDSSAWSGLSAAAVAAGSQEGVDRWRLRLASTSAAANAYQTSRTAGERALALRRLGEALEWRQMYRPAIEAFAASLAIDDDPQVRAQYEDLRERQGFRIVDNTIDSDSRTPRACVQFSEPLAKSGVNYADYVTLNGGSAEIAQSGDREICVEGLRHGERYSLQLRQGLPSAIGEVLSGNVTLDLYVRDRAPSVRFAGDNFVLPAAGRHGIPVVSVNTAKVELQLLRIGERALANVLGNSQFLRQLDSYSLQTLAEENGEKLWDGSLETAIEQNKEVVTSLPVDEALPERKPGIYVLSARAEGSTAEDWEARATQWFVISDIGLTAASGEDGIHILARSLANAEALPGVALQLVARNNDVLGEATTDAEGRAHFAAGLARGTGGMAPQAVIAKGNDFVFLDLGRAGFDFSDRGVEGRPAPGSMDVMAWTERGIYRAGETVHVTALARNPAAEAIDDLPLTFIFRRPDGVEYLRMTSAGPKLGGHDLALDLPDNAMRGSWTLAVHADPERPALAQTPFLVEDFIPDRIEFDLKAGVVTASAGEAFEVEVDGRFLYGAPAAGLAMEGTLDILPVRNWQSLPGFQFGLDDEEETERSNIPLDGLPTLDEDGKASFTVSLDDLPSTTALLNAEITVRLLEGGGRAVERRLEVPILPEGEAIGIRPEFEGGSVPENTEAGFRFAAIGPDGERIAIPGAKWTLLKVERDFQWYRNESGWNYETVDYTAQVADGTIDIGADEPARLRVPVGWGRYRLEVESPDGAAISSLTFNAGWYVEARSTDTPDGLEISLDKETYRAGDVAKLRVSPRFAGKLSVLVGAEQVLSSFTADIPENGGTVDIPVSADWGAGAYIAATLFRPAGEDGSRLPMRAIGVKWLGIDPSDRKLAVTLDAPEKTEPLQHLAIPVSVAGAKPGERAYVTLAAVDVGILNLTRYEAPNPDAWYFGQRRLGLQYRDLYGRLIDGSAGVPGRLRTGGDGGGMRIEGSPPTEKLVAFHSGIVELDAEGKAVIGFDLPRFNGTVRLMAVAWTASGVGHAEKDVIVREPVIVTASLPRFLAPGDNASMQIELALAEAPEGEYRLSVTAEGALRSDASERMINLSAQGRSQVVVPLSAMGTGDGLIRIALEGADGLRLEQVHELPVRPGSPLIANRMEIELAASGGSLRLDQGLLDGFYPDDASVSLTIAPLEALDVPAILMSLDRYPYGCSEQITSRAMPLLYVSELSRAAGFDEDPEATGRIRDAIRSVLSNQSSSGSFGLWSPGDGDLWLDAYVSDFLTRARELNFEVPELSMRLALDNLQNTLAYTTDVEAQGPAIAYALYVLARNRRAAAGDLRYYADTQLDAFATPMARAQIGASLALYGDHERARNAFASALALAEEQGEPLPMRNDYGSRLRDRAALMALATESRQYRPEMGQLLQASLAGRRNMSTQEQAWTLLAARAVEEETSANLTVNGVAHTGNLALQLDGAEVLERPVTVANPSSKPVTAIVTTLAAPREPLPAGGNGFTIERNYYGLDGEPVNVSEVKQNERFVAVIRIVEENAWPSRVLVSDLLPAGFEIDNPAIIRSADLAGFEWLPEIEVAHVEFRDDSFVAAFDRTADSPREVTLAYVVRAVTPGTFAHPAASVEDMYRPELSARTASSVLTVEAP